MNLTYFKFLFVTTIRKKPIWITWLLYLLTCVMFIIVMPAVAQITPLQVWSNTTMAVCQSFLGMVVALFSAVLAIAIFKDPNEEGTELIVVSKPVSRIKLVFSKFAIFICFGLLVNLTAVIITLFTIAIPEMEIKFYWGLVLSMFIGNIVSFGAFGSLAALVASRTQKVGVIVVNVLTSLVFLIYQILTLFVFSTPLKQLTDHNISANSAMIARRLEDGSYDEQHIVQFNPSINNQNTIDKIPNLKSSDDMLKFWEDDIMAYDISPVLDWTDLAGQVALSYDSINVNGFSERQASRMFAMSRFYRYTLTNPASSEVDGNEDRGIHFIYGLPTQIKLNQWFDFIPDEYEFYWPSNLYYLSINETDSVSLSGGVKDKMPIGYVRDNTTIFGRNDVYFEKDQYNKYTKPYIDSSSVEHKAAFEQIADNIFRHDLKLKYPKPDGSFVYSGHDSPDLDYINLRNLWMSSQTNLSRFYQTLWYYLMGCPDVEQFKEEIELADEFKLDSCYNTEFFDINSVEDLNERFIQFKYYIVEYVYKKQQELLNTPSQELLPPIDNIKYTETEFGPEKINLKQKTMDALNDYGILALEGIKLDPSTWWTRSDINNFSLIPLLQPNTHTPSFDFMWRVYYAITDYMLNEPRTFTDENVHLAQYNSTFAKFFALAAITSTMVKSENYMFDSLSAPTRSSNFDGFAYIDDIVESMYWKASIDAIGQYFLNGEILFPHNSKMFYYTTTPAVNYWVFAVIWMLISLAAYGAAVVIYCKYDIK